MRCPVCQANNVEGRRFCAQCGAPLASPCPGCGFANEPAARFCGGCGAALVKGGEPAQPAADGERRQVAVLFADLSGYTRLTSELGAEEVHELTGRFFERVDRLIRDHGGTVDKHIGDCVMAVFGAPVAHGNDAERAARAALAIRPAVAGIEHPGVGALGVHIGIASGQVVVGGTGSAGHREYTVTGESVNLASRLTDAAQDGEILISDAVQRALGERAACQDVGELQVAGLRRPVRAWRLLGVGTGEPAARARLLVGRERELQHFRAALASCRATGQGQTLYLRGEAGIGKTRLAEEFQEEAARAGFGVHTGLVLDFGAGAGGGAVAAIVQSLLGLPAGAAAGELGRAVGAAFEQGLVLADQRVFLNDLLDLPQPPQLRALYDAMDDETRTRGKRECVSALVVRAARARPRLALVEDVHWADAATLDLLAAVAETVAGAPALLVMTSRIEGDQLGEAWRSRVAGSALTTIDLGPLRPQDMRTLAAGVVGRQVAEVARWIERASGNPLFLEQFLRQRETGPEAAVPDTIQSLVQARVDRLEPHDRLALQAASVFGQRFALDGLRALIDDAAYGCQRLVAHFLVRPRGGEFLFAHALIRDAVYDTLLRPRRRELHRRAAAWFAGRDLVLQAEHLERAEDPQAPRAYLAAARAHAGEYRYEQARRLAERGLELAREAAELAELEAVRGDILHDQGDMPAAMAAYQQALAVAANDTQRCRALIGRAAAMRMTERLDEAFASLAEGERLANALGLQAELARIHYLRGNLCFPRGDLAGCLAEHERALALARATGSVELEAQALGGLADADYARGRLISAARRFRECVAIARQHGLGRIAVANLPMAGIARTYGHEFEQALADQREAIDAAQRVGHQRAEMIARHGAFFCHFTRAELEPARAHTERALELARQLGAARFEAEALSFLGDIARASGQREQAVALLEEAIAISRKSGMAFIGPMHLSSLALATADPARREAALAEGEALLAAGSACHNHLWFYANGIDTALEWGEWERALDYADALERYTRPEPLPWSDLLVARARALAAHGRGDRDAGLQRELGRLRDWALRVEHRSALPALEAALERRPVTGDYSGRQAS